MKLTDIIIDIHQLRPLMFDSDTYEFDARIIYNGEQYTIKQQIPLDAFHSLFDVIWMDTGEKIKRSILKNEGNK
jgi:hypothetical protein